MHPILLSIILSLLLVPGQPAFCQNEKGLTERGDSLFRTENFEEARIVYSEIFASSGLYSPSLLLKLAFLEEYRGNISGALYFLSLYEQHHPDKEIREKISDLAGKYNLQGYDFHEWDYFFFQIRKYKRILALSISALAVAYGFHLFLKRRNHTPLGIRPLVILLTLMLLFYLLNFRMEPKAAITVAGPAPVMEGPSASSKQVFLFPEGYKVKITGETDIWYEIRFKGRDLYIRKSQTRVLL